MQSFRQIVARNTEVLGQAGGTQRLSVGSGGNGQHRPEGILSRLREHQVLAREEAFIG